MNCENLVSQVYPVVAKVQYKTEEESVMRMKTVLVCTCYLFCVSIIRFGIALPINKISINVIYPIVPDIGKRGCIRLKVLDLFYLKLSMRNVLHLLENEDYKDLQKNFLRS